MTSLRQAVSLALDIAGVKGEITIGNIVNEVRIKHPFRRWYPDEIIDAEMLFLRHVVTAGLKEPMTPEYIEKHLQIEIDPAYRDLVAQIPTKYICIDRNHGGIWRHSLYCPIEGLKANYQLKWRIGNAALRKAEIMRDIILLAEANGAPNLMELIKK